MAGRVRRVFEHVTVFKADGSEATRESKKAEKGIAGYGKALLGVAAAITGVVAAAFAKLTKLYAEATKAAAEQQEAVAKLDVSLRELGAAAPIASEALQRQAAALQGISKFGDEAIIGTQAFLKQLGVSVEQLEEATLASVNLSEAFGIGLTEAARNVGKTIGGFAGELGELIPELKEFTAEQLQAGKGIEFLSEKFKGIAEETDSYAESLARLKNVQSDTFEAFGKGAVESEALAGAVGNLTSAYEGMQGSAERAGEVAARLDTVWTNLKATAVSYVDVLLEFSFGQDKIVEGFTQAELRARHFNAEVAKSEAAAKAAAIALEKNLAEALERSVRGYDAAIAGAKALGVETSVTLTQKILEIQQALLVQRDLLGENSLEYENLRRVAGAAIDEMLAKIERLKRGQTDANETITEATEKTSDMAESLDAAAEAAVTLTDRNRELTRELDRNTLAAERNASAHQLGDPSSVGTTGIQFSGGKFVFINGRRAQVFPDGRVVYP